MPCLIRKSIGQPKSVAALRPDLPPLKRDYPPKLRRQMLARLMSKLGKRPRDMHT